MLDHAGMKLGNGHAAEARRAPALESDGPPSVFAGEVSRQLNPPARSDQSWMKFAEKVGRTVLGEPRLRRTSRDARCARALIGNAAERLTLWVDPGSAGTPRPTLVLPAWWFTFHVSSTPSVVPPLDPPSLEQLWRTSHTGVKHIVVAIFVSIVVGPHRCPDHCLDRCRRDVIGTTIATTMRER